MNKYNPADIKFQCIFTWLLFTLNISSNKTKKRYSSSRLKKLFMHRSKIIYEKEHK